MLHNPSPQESRAPRETGDESLDAYVAAVYAAAVARRERDISPAAAG